MWCILPSNCCAPASHHASPALPCLQVVGRLSAGRDLLPLLNAIKTDVNDAPQQHRVKVARCGFTDAGGRGCACYCRFKDSTMRVEVAPCSLARCG